MKRLFVFVLLFVSVFSAKGERSGKEVYLDIMQKAVEAYSPQRIQQYADRVSSEGVTEHGFALLTSNVGIMVSRGRMPQMKDTFIELMDICAREVPIALEKNREVKRLKVKVQIDHNRI